MKSTSLTYVLKIIWERYENGLSFRLCVMNV